MVLVVFGKADENKFRDVVACFSELALGEVEEKDERGEDTSERTKKNELVTIWHVRQIVRA